MSGRVLLQCTALSVGLDQAGIHCKPLAANQSGRDARRHHVLEYPPGQRSIPGKDWDRERDPDRASRAVKERQHSAGSR
jgi:hypothetical protein